MKTLLPVIEEHRFSAKDLVGGDVVLDFVNTVTGRNGHPRDWIGCYGDLVDWAALVGLLAERDRRRLERRVIEHPTEAEAALVEARELRELLYGVLTRWIDGRKVPEADLTRLQARWRQSVGAHELRLAEDGIRPHLPMLSSRLTALVDELTLRAVEFLRHLPRGRVRQCSGPDCAWLFVDTSKAGRRRWCDMATCGNSAKAKRFLLAKKGSKQRSEA